MTCRHTAYNIGVQLQNIFHSYNLSRTNHSIIVTDNGSNFACLFKDLEIDLVETRTGQNDDLPGEIEDFQIIENPLNRNDGFDEMEEQEEYFAEIKRNLPCRISCASHTLSLICISDMAKKALQLSFPSQKNEPNVKTKVFSLKYRRSIGICTALWNLLSRSTQANEDFEKNVKKKEFQDQ